MDFKAMDVKEALAKFLREQMQRQGLTVEKLAEISILSERTIHNYLNPNQAQAPETISDKFYSKMQSALQFQHEDFVQYYDNHHFDQSRNIIGTLNISGGTFDKPVFGAKEVHFHDASNDTDD